VKIVGFVTTAVTTAVALFLAVVVVRSMPDIRRYLKIRTM
jgi:hypothetical protein